MNEAYRQRTKELKEKYRHMDAEKRRERIKQLHPDKPWRKIKFSEGDMDLDAMDKYMDDLYEAGFPFGPTNLRYPDDRDMMDRVAEYHRKVW